MSANEEILNAVRTAIKERIPERLVGPIEPYPVATSFKFNISGVTFIVWISDVFILFDAYHSYNTTVVRFDLTDPDVNPVEAIVGCVERARCRLSGG